MTDTQPGSASGAAAATRRRGGPLARLLVFLREVVGELKKVVYPTRDELVTYTSVVLVFVAVVMTYVSLLDLGFGRLVLWVLGGS
ncbi:preprotein translocase subunit SecE [Quadrisphaera oryzae]|uniref:preprotein translocase subunit SecE n=1 Tax=Quadrisphaera TaxID=317661 RepID=UPI001646EE51|nr:preprotein translocase subunit SecE [Quadrisphaera sp. RL12-1S]